MCKGADQSILSRLDKRVYQDSPDQKLLKIKDHVLKKVDAFARKGYRGLLMAIRVLSEEEVSYYQKEYSALSELNLDDKKVVYQDFLKELESNLILIGGSAVEDKLQEDLKDTIESLRNAQMKIWVLTGDKMETAENIAISSGLFNLVVGFILLIERMRKME
jgi:magnesium-transporting ATPase (P-type)